MKPILLCAALLVSACSSSTNGRGGPGTDGSVDTTQDLGTFPDAFFVDEPAPMCALDGTVFPPPPAPGGTDECPDDKNREGCDCTTENMVAPCWPGARKNRGLGICKDGMTTCTRTGELSLTWGPCVGYVLPDPTATDGAAACKCFSHGTWKLDNLSPCFFSNTGDPTGSGGAVSTIPGAAAGSFQCPADASSIPSQNWADDTVTADCSGRFKLCLTLKAGDATKPQATDCTLASSCVTGDYIDVNKAQAFPPLPPWLSTSASQQACAEQFASTGGYGEMSVDGETVSCDKFNRVFTRVNYCPLACNTDPSGPGCSMCSQGGSGGF